MFLSLTSGISKIREKKFRFSSALRVGFLIILPAIALVLSLRTLANQYANRGIAIRVAVKEAEGVEIDRTPLKYRGVEIGTVTSMRIVDSNVMVDISVDRRFREALGPEARIHLVRPQLSWSGVSGLNALRGGPYFSLENAGRRADDDLKTEFVDFSAAVDEFAELRGPSFKLLSIDSRELAVGSPVFYRGVKVGEVISIRLSSKLDQAVIGIRVSSRFRRAVRRNTVFWKARAVHADFGLFSGASITVSSLEALVRGGIHMATPDEAEGLAPANAEFRLRADAPSGALEWRPAL